MRKLTPAEARRMAALRQTNGAGPGRPRSKKRRCPCGAMTLKRAEARRGRSGEHGRDCPYYVERRVK